MWAVINNKIDQLKALSRMKGLTEKQKKFCWIYVVEDNDCIYAVHAYAKAYQIDISTPRGNQVARSGASRLLKNPKVSEYYWKLSDLKGC